MQVLTHSGPRVVTDVTQFGDDWPGVFIRGDNAFAYALALQAVLDGRADVFAKASAGSLLKLLQSSNIRNFEEDIAP